MVEDELKQAIADDPRGVMIIVGAGVTLSALQNTEHQPRASWGGLIRDGIAYAVAQGRLAPDDGERLEGLLGSTLPGMWISAAEQLTAALGGPEGGDFRGWLRRSVGALAGSIRDRSVLDPLAELSRHGVTIATVNYDSVLESITGLRPVTWRQPSEVVRVLRGDAQGVLHLHGHWEDPASIVLGTSSYGEVVRDEHARTVLESMQMFRTLVFIGHGAGLSDPNWGSMLSWSAKVIAGSEHRHYRIAREAELAELRNPELQAQRISLVGYKGGYENLGPFLQTLVPKSAALTTRPQEDAALAPEAEAKEGPPVEHVLLLINIGEDGYRFVAREAVERYSGVAKIDHVLEIDRRDLDLTNAGPADWRGIAKEVDDLVDRAEQAALDAPGSVCFVIAGVAPSPIFLYLGYQFKRLTGKVLLVNRNDVTSEWERIGPYGGAHEFPASLREVFTFQEPKRVGREDGRVAIFVACSTVFQCDDDTLEQVTEAEGQSLNGIFKVISSLNPRTDADGSMTASDLSALMDLVSKAMIAAEQACASSKDLVLAFGGPMWVAFWLGRTLNPKVVGNIELPNFVKGRGYVRALAPQMWRERWIAGPTKTLVLTAEPNDEARTRAGAQLAAIQKALEDGQGRDARAHLLHVPAAKVGELLVRLDQERPHILHFYGHGSPDGSLGFEDDRGNLRIVRPERFLEVLRATGVRPALTVLCACYSAALADGLLELSDCVLNVKGTVPYDEASTFIGAFYDALARGRTVKEAHSRAVAHTGLVLDPNEQRFELLGVDPSRVFFWRAARGRR